MPGGSQSPIRRAQQWLSSEQAEKQVLAYYRRFGPDHVLLACHAAFASIVSPEIVNLIHLNFLDGFSIPWLAEPDFLLSTLCRPLGEGAYEVVPSIREQLLRHLREERDPDIEARLADFLLAFLDSPRGRQQRPQYQLTQRWIALAYLDPHGLLQEMTALLEENLDSKPAVEGLLSRHIQIATMMEVLRDPLTAGLPEKDYREITETAELLAHYWYVDKTVVSKTDTRPAAAASAAVGSANKLLSKVKRALEKAVPAPPAPETPVFLEDGVSDFAIVIGIGRYPGLPMAQQNAEANARAFLDWLTDPEAGNLPQDQVIQLISESAANAGPTRVTLHRVQEVLANLLVEGQALRLTGRRLFLYFSGLVIKTRENLLLLVPDSGPDATANHISLNDYVSYFRQLGAFRELVVFIDAIETHYPTPKLSHHAWPFPLGDETRPVTSVVITYLTSVYQLELDTGPSIFTRELLEGLRGGAASPGSRELDDQELSHYLQAKFTSIQVQSHYASARIRFRTSVPIQRSVGSTEQELARLEAALLSAFHSITSLRIMVRTRLNERLEAISGSSSLKHAVHELVAYFENHGRTRDLLRAALEENPRNSALQALSAGLGMGTGRGEPDLNLTGAQRQRLHALLCKIYRPADLNAFSLSTFERSLWEIAGEGSLQDIAFDLIRWAEAHGQLKELVDAARQAWPNHPDLQTLAGELTSAASPHPAEEPPPARLALTGKQLGELKDEFARRFSREELMRLASFRFNLNLNELGEGKTLNELAMLLLEWAEENNQMAALLEEAINERPNSSVLKTLSEILAASSGLKAQSQPAAQAPQVLRSAKILIAGSCKNSSSQSEFHAFVNACQELGKALATAGCTIIVGSSSADTADYHVLDGANQASQIAKIVIIRPKQGDTSGGLEHTLTNLAVERQLFEGRWKDVRDLQVNEAALVIVIGGRSGTRQVIQAALRNHKPLLPIAACPGTARDAWPATRAELISLGMPGPRVNALEQTFNADLALEAIRLLMAAPSEGSPTQPRPNDQQSAIKPPAIERYLVDGYNLAAKLNLPLGGKSKGAALRSRNKLLKMLQIAAGPGASGITVVFDAGNLRGGKQAAKRYKDLHVVHATNQSADEQIELLLRIERHPQELRVVSEDRRIQKSARRLNCPVLECTDFLAHLTRGYLRRTQQGSDLDAKLLALPPSDVEAWMGQFRHFSDETRAIEEWLRTIGKQTSSTLTALETLMRIPGLEMSVVALWESVLLARQQLDIVQASLAQRELAWRLWDLKTLKSLLPMMNAGDARDGDSVAVKVGLYRELLDSWTARNQLALNRFTDRALADWVRDFQRLSQSLANWSAESGQENALLTIEGLERLVFFETRKINSSFQSQISDIGLPRIVEMVDTIQKAATAESAPSRDLEMLQTTDGALRATYAHVMEWLGKGDPGQFASKHLKEMWDSLTSIDASVDLEWHCSLLLERLREDQLPESVSEEARSARDVLLAALGEAHLGKTNLASRKYARSLLGCVYEFDGALLQLCAELRPILESLVPPGKLLPN
jgi:hypothetical protein